MGAVKTATFNGRAYKIILEELDGNTDTDDYHWLIVCRDLNTRVGLETAVHEALHACCWRSQEQTVERTAKDISRFLWRLGYRRKIGRAKV